MIIVVRGLRKVHGSTVALQGLDIEIEAGGVVGILGPNGAGKTTFVETLEGLREPTSGSVTVLGMDPAKQGKALRERLGVQLQRTALPTELTVREMLDLFASFYASALPSDSILEKVDLVPQAAQKAATLSGGQQQRLVVGIALINDPELVILDEPTTSLDPKARRDLHGVIRELREQGRT